MVEPGSRIERDWERDGGKLRFTQVNEREERRRGEKSQGMKTDDTSKKPIVTRK